MPDTSDDLPDVIDGTPVAESALPIGKLRRVFDMGAHMMQMVHKRGEDTLDWFIDLLKFLEPGETIISASGYVAPDDLAIQRLQYADTGVVVWLTGGDDGVRHTVYCTIQTSRGLVKLFRFVVLTRGENVRAQVDLIITIDSITVALPQLPGEGGEPDPEAPTISFSSLSLAFDAVVIGGGTDDMILTITNTGTAPLVITGATTSGNFSVIGSSA